MVKDLNNVECARGLTSFSSIEVEKIKYEAILQSKPLHDPENKIIKRSWINNCVAVGLSMGFVEPLEATGISNILGAARFIENIIFDDSLYGVYGDFGDIETAERISKYNHDILGHIASDTYYIAFHYILNNRNDTEFWKYFHKLYNKDKIDPCEISSLQEYFEFYNKLEFLKYRDEDGIYSYKTIDDEDNRLYLQPNLPDNQQPIIKNEPVVGNYINETFWPNIETNSPWDYRDEESFIIPHLYMLLGMNYKFDSDDRVNRV